MYSADFMFKVPYFQGRWNEHKDVKEDKEQELFYFMAARNMRQPQMWPQVLRPHYLEPRKTYTNRSGPKKVAAVTALTAFGGLSSGD